MSNQIVRDAYELTEKMAKGLDWSDKQKIEFRHNQIKEEVKKLVQERIEP